MKMLDKNAAEVHTHIAGKRSINKALDLLKTTKARNGKKLADDTDKYDKISKYCTSTVSMKRKKNSCIVGFSHSFATSQIRSCIARQDWINAQRLIPLLLEFSLDKEPLIWRFALSILLTSPESSAAHLLGFLEKCMGSTSEIESGEPERFLKQLLTLPINKSDK